MFTGIVKATGRIVSMTPTDGDLTLTIRSDGLPWPAYEVGESIAVNGVCLTAVRLDADGFATDVSNETLRVTALGDIGLGASVNLEPSLTAGDRLGGHLVSGHVDCVGIVVSRERDARSMRIEVELPETCARYVARKGSICIDGVSLTVNTVKSNRFSVNIIPHTAEVTIIGGYRQGTRVNIEVDLLARYVERLLDPDARGLSPNTLGEHGHA